PRARRAAAAATSAIVTEARRPRAPLLQRERPRAMALRLAPPPARDLGASPSLAGGLGASPSLAGVTPLPPRPRCGPLLGVAGGPLASAVVTGGSVGRLGLRPGRGRSEPVDHLGGLAAGVELGGGDLDGELEHLGAGEAPGAAGDQAGQDRHDP